MPPRKSRYPGVYPSGKTTWLYKLRLPPDPVTGKRPTETRGGYATDYEAHLARSARLVELGQGVNTAPSDLTVTQAVEQYIEGRAMKPASRHLYGYLVRRFITPHIGSVRVRDLTPARVRAWLMMLQSTGREDGQPLSASTVANVRALLSSALRQAHLDGTIPRNVVQQTAGVPIPRHEVETWSLDEAHQFLAVSDEDDYAALWRLGLLALLRPGELVALRWDDVNLSSGVVTIRQTATRDERGTWTVGDPKTPASAAPVGVSAVTLQRLQDLRDIQRLSNRGRPDDWRHDLCFPNRHGRMMSHTTLSQRLMTLCRRAGVPELTPHKLRTTGATLLITTGTDPSTLMRSLRHTNAAFSIRTYTHARLQHQQDAVRQLEVALAGVRTDDEDDALFRPAP